MSNDVGPATIAADDLVPVGAGALCLVDDGLLLVRRGIGPAGGEWNLPVVAVRSGESVAEAVVRACADQAGSEVLCGPFIAWNEHPGEARPTVELFFDAVLLDPLHTEPAVPSGASRPAGPEHPIVEARFVPVEQVTELRLVAGLAEFLADAGVIDTVV